MKVTFAKQITQLEHATVEAEIMSYSEYTSQVRPMLDLLDKRMAGLNKGVIDANVKMGNLTEKEAQHVLNTLFAIQGIRLPSAADDPGRPVAVVKDEDA